MGKAPMLAQVILGLLEDGTEGTAYALAKEYRRRTGIEANEGNVRNRLAQLAEKSLIMEPRGPSELDAKPSEASGGRLKHLYRITDGGRRAFHQWLLSPLTLRGEMYAWILFLKRIPPDTLDAILQGERGHRLQRCKSLSHQLEDEQAHASLNGYGFTPRTFLLTHELKHAVTDLELLEDLQEQVKRLRHQGALDR